MNSENVCIDGNIDNCRHFHPIVTALCSKNTKYEVSFVFQTIKNELARLHDHNYAPTILIADAAHQETNGFKDFFGSDFRRVMCWPHVYRRYTPKLSKIIDKVKRNSIRNDIESMQLATSTYIFDTLMAKFFKKYKYDKAIPEKDDKDPVNIFLRYFDKEWVSSNNLSCSYSVS